MNVYQIALPLRTNDGEHDYADSLHNWEAVAAEIVGGFTDLGHRRGVWRDANTGKVYDETMAGYQFAGDDGHMHVLLDVAKGLFPDQVAFYVAKVGTAEIYLNHRRH